MFQSSTILSKIEGVKEIQKFEDATHITLQLNLYKYIMNAIEHIEYFWLD